VRYSIGRAITIPPGLLMMDEPLSNLNPKSRVKAMDEIRKLQSELKATTVCVTHNLVEAFVDQEIPQSIRDTLNEPPTHIHSKIQEFMGSKFLGPTISCTYTK